MALHASGTRSPNELLVEPIIMHGVLCYQGRVLPPQIVFLFIRLLCLEKHNSLQHGKQTKPETKFWVEALSLILHMTFSGVLSSVHTGHIYHPSFFRMAGRVP